MPQRLFNNLEQTDRRRGLRSRQTPHEEELWRHLKSRKLNGFKFRRQQGIGHFIVDFYCSSARLAIELDGASHSTKKGLEKDKIRTELLESQGIRILRFKNEEVFENCSEVLAAIAEALSEG